MTHRIEKFTSTLHQTLAEILLLDSKDPIFKQVSISQVAVSRDLRQARIFISSHEGDVDQLITKLVNAKGYLKQVLAKRLYSKYVPDLIFVKDEAFEIDQKISQVMREQE